jgi:hypothetical protein
VLALIIAKEIGDRREEANLLANQGLAYGDLVETKKAIEFFKESLVIGKSIEDQRIISHCENILKKLERVRNEEVLFERTIHAIENNLCFVLMPFRPNFNELYNIIIKPAINYFKIKCKRGDEVYTKSVIDDVWKCIQRSRFIVADLTGQNSNVCYELGLCHAINKDVIIITQNMNDVPFDLRHLRCIVYSDTQEGRIKLRNDLSKAMISFKFESSLLFEVIFKFGETGKNKGQLSNSRDIAIGLSPKV